MKSIRISTKVVHVMDSAILALRWLPSIDTGWFDLEAGILYRTGSKVSQSKKRRPPANSAILALRWLPSIDAGLFDLEAGILYRTGSKVSQSKKRQPPAKIHGRLMPHLRRWRDADMACNITSVVHYKGERVRKLRRSWESVAKLAGSRGKDGPHILRHTAATWMMRCGVDAFEASGFLGMTPEILWEVCWPPSSQVSRRVVRRQL